MKSNIEVYFIHSLNFSVTLSAKFEGQCGNNVPQEGKKSRAYTGSIKCNQWVFKQNIQLQN